MALATLPEPDLRDEDEKDDDEQDASRMSFLEHLDELRRRLTYSIVALLVGFLIALGLIQPIFDFVMRPMRDLLPPGSGLMYNEPTEAFMLQLKMAALAGLILAMPICLWQAWRFVAPGLYANEKRIAIPFVVLATAFFTLGVIFSHYVLFPVTWKFFASFASDYLEFLPRIEPAFSLYLKLALAMGAVFQVPTIVYFLTRMRMITPRWMWRNVKYAILVSFILGAVLTPSADPVSQTLMSLPTIGLYLISIGIAWAFQPRS